MSMQVGIPGMLFGRRTARVPVNPMDKSTVVSIYPKDIVERKPTIQPGIFHVKAGSYANPSVLVVGSSSWFKEVDAEQPLLEIPDGSVQIANAIVRDFCNGLLGSNMNSSMPGLFWVPGEFSVSEIKKNHRVELDKALAKQVTYYRALVKMGSGMWAKTGGNPLSISDDMRLAAKELNLSDTLDWMKDFSMMGNLNCKACGFSVKPGYPVCSNCRAIVDVDQAKELGIVFAAQVG